MDVFIGMNTNGTRKVLIYHQVSTVLLYSRGRAVAETGSGKSKHFAESEANARRDKTGPPQLALPDSQGYP